MENSILEQCQYLRRNGERCEYTVDTDGGCFWHSSKVDKKGKDIKSPLEKMVRKGKPLEGFRLAHANLEGVNLVHRGTREQINLMDADLYRTNLQNAHFFNVNLSGGSLMKANLSGANFNLARLEGTNLLGTKFNQTKLENVAWGDQILQERHAFERKQKGDHKNELRLFKEAEETYRHLQKAYDNMGLFDNAGVFFKKGMTMRRYQLPLWSAKRLVSKIVDITCGYGESPVRVILFSLSLIFSFALLYFFFGIQGPEHVTRYQPDIPFFSNIIYLLEALYFSVVTFTTFSYGDISPVGLTRIFASFEALVGFFSIGLFVVVFVKKMLR